MAEHAMVVRVAHLVPKEGSRDQAESLAGEIADRARDVPGCFGAQVCRVKERPEELALISRWESEAALADAVADPRYRQAAGELEGVIGEAIRTENYISV
jgi:quinol monooxygenase YgiN